MRLWQHLKRWEMKTERAPKPKLIKTLLVYFCVSLFIGASVASLVQASTTQSLKIQALRLKEQEKLSMDQLVKISKDAKMKSPNSF